MKIIDKMKKNVETQVANKQKGNVVISVLLVIVVLAVIALFAYKTFESAMEKNRIDQAKTQIENISQGVDELYANSHDFSNISTQVIIDGGIADKDNVVGTTIVAPWYSSDSTSLVTVKPGTGPATYTVDMAGIPKEACSAVSSVFLSKSTLTVNGTAVTDQSTLTTACASSDTAELAIDF